MAGELKINHDGTDPCEERWGGGGEELRARRQEREGCQWRKKAEGRQQGEEEEKEGRGMYIGQEIHLDTG